MVIRWVLMTGSIGKLNRRYWKWHLILVPFLFHHYPTMMICLFTSYPPHDFPTCLHPNPDPGWKANAVVQGEQHRIASPTTGRVVGHWSAMWRMAFHVSKAGQRLYWPTPRTGQTGVGFPKWLWTGCVICRLNRRYSIQSLESWSLSWILFYVGNIWYYHHCIIILPPISHHYTTILLVSRGYMSISRLNRRYCKHRPK